MGLTQRLHLQAELNYVFCSGLQNKQCGYFFNLCAVLKIGFQSGQPGAFTHGLS